MISEKYLAGFLDADGSIQIAWRHIDRTRKTPEIQNAYLVLEFSQETKQDKVIYLIQQVFGGNISYYKMYTNLRIMGTKAVQILNRIKQHLVIKKHYAEFCLSIVNQKHDRKIMSKILKEQRKIQSHPLPNFPSRKWLAGYLDGDGCFTCRLPKNRNSVQPMLEVAASNYDSEGIELIQKVFGGSIQSYSSTVKHLVISLPPSKLKQIWEYCGDYLITKHDQLLFLYGCAKMGHYHDGKRIKEFVKQLKAHPHRLNEQSANVQGLLQQVVDRR